MRAKSINESRDERLKIYRFPDGTYEATRDGKLFTFLWKPYKVYNIKKIGGVGPSWMPQGRLFRNPHIQMTLQVQNAINTLNESVIDIFESITNTLKPKTLRGIEKQIWDEVIPDLKSVGFKPREPQMSHGFYSIDFTPINNAYTCQAVYVDSKIANKSFAKDYLVKETLDEWYAKLTVSKYHSTFHKPLSTRIAQSKDWKTVFKNIINELYGAEDVVLTIAELEKNIEDKELQIKQFTDEKTYLEEVNRILGGSR